jgi:hypothetical protein
MNRRELLTGAAVLAGVTQANAFGIGKEGASGGFGHAGAVLGGASNPIVSLSSANGSATTDGHGRTVITFSSDDVLLSSIPFYADVVEIGGGGAGGTGAGGGAGRFRYFRNVLFGTQTPIKIGLGGAGITGGIKGNPGLNTSALVNGNPLYASGGAAPNAINTSGLVWRTGSGPGVASASSVASYTVAPGEGTDGTNAGGNVTTFASPFAGGGGGGAGGVGGDATVTGHAGTAGPGISNSITGSALFYAGGGGATCFSNGGAGSTPTAGGSSVGGDGAGTGGNGGNGVDGTGSGGGGGYNTGTSGKGGRGVLIILPLSKNATHGTKTIAPTGSAISEPIGSGLLAFYSVVKLSGWAGSCLQITRASDSTTLDIGFVNNIVDWQSADAFGVGTTITVSKIYDQSGGGNDLTGSGSVQLGLPTFSGFNTWINGIRPVSVQGQGNTFFQALSNATIVGNTNAVSIYQVVAPRTSTDFQGYWALTDAAQTSYWSTLYHNGGSQLLLQPKSLSALNTGFYPRGAPGTISVSSSGTTGQIVRVNGSQFTNSGNTGSQAFGGLRVGIGSAGTNFGIFDFFCMAVYSSAHNSTQMQSVEAAINAPFNLQSSFTKRVVYGGSSLVPGYQSTSNQQAPWQSGFGKSSLGPIPDWEPILMGVAARSLATEYSIRAVYAGLYDGTKQANVCIIDAPSNDISLATVTDHANAVTQATTLFNNTTVPFVQYLQGIGFQVVVPTCIARGTFTTVNFKEDYRQAYNALVIANAATYGYTVAQRTTAGPTNALDTQAVAVSDTTTYPDGTHLSNRDYAYMGAADRLAITGYSAPLAA